MRPLHRTVSIEAVPLKEPFVIARGSKTVARVVVVTLSDGPFLGRGECVPYARYGETPEAVAAALDTLPPAVAHDALAALLQPGAALNAIDCAFHDLNAKRSGLPVHQLLGLPDPAPVITAYTLSLDRPDAMAAKARSVPQFPLLKLKLGGEGDAERMRAVRAERPEARLIADANEAWLPSMLAGLLAAAHAARFELIEQPLPAGADAILEGLARPVPICADESAHTAADILGVARRYDAVNIKLDKAGGLTGGLAMLRAARAAGLKVMLGSMVSTSLAVAPALLLAGAADWVDLDGPLLVARDRVPGLTITNGSIAPAPRALWG